MSAGSVIILFPAIFPWRKIWEKKNIYIYKHSIKGYKRIENKKAMLLKMCIIYVFYLVCFYQAAQENNSSV